MNRRTVHFSGHVQGVGFRYTVQSLASRYKVSGYVRNLPDGRVELVVEGDDAEIDHLINAIKQQMEQFVRTMNAQTSPASGEFSGFSIRH